MGRVRCNLLIVEAHIASFYFIDVKIRRPICDPLICPVVMLS